jgi:NodT family efflux transporter outer membrane factor (OMF) lipoprotein
MNNFPLAGRRAFAASLLTVTGILAGCTSGPDFVRPAPPGTQRYATDERPAIADSNSGDPAQNFQRGAPLLAEWWTLFRSPELDRTVALALANNHTLAVAEANVARARQEIAAARGALLPQIDGTTSAAHEKYGASFLGPEAFTFPRFSPYAAGAEASWDVDLFGGNRRRVEEEAASAEVEQHRLDAARLQIASGVVIQALQIAATRAQIQVIEGVVASDAKTLELVTTACSTGVATRVDVATARTQLDRDQTLLPALRQQLAVAQSALAVLVGKAPGDWQAPDFRLDALALPTDLPLAVPSTLVRTRPDILAAEADLHAANAAVGVATADLYPRLTLTGALAGQGLFTGGFGSAWSIVGGLAAPVFHGGTLTARKRAAIAARDAAFQQYQQTVLKAFREVADALHGLANSADAVGSETRALTSSTDALDLTRHGFADGNIGIVQVLDAQRLQALAKNDLVQARAQRLVQTVVLFVSMGGGAQQGGVPN